MGVYLRIIEPQHDKTNKMTCAPSEDWASPSQISLRRPYEETLSPRLSIERTDWGDAQADLSLHWAHVILLVLSCYGSMFSGIQIIQTFTGELTLRSLTSGCSLRRSRNEEKKSDLSTCLGATHRVSISAPVRIGTRFALIPCDSFT